MDVLLCFRRHSKLMRSRMCLVERGTTELIDTAVPFMKMDMFLTGLLFSSQRWCDDLF